MARWNRALHTAKVVSTTSYDRMTTPTGTANVTPPLYGFGLIRDTIAGRDLITHGGGIHGFVTSNSWLPSAALSVTVLTNGVASPPDRLMKQIIRASIGAPLDVPKPAVPLAAADRDRYLGVYSLMLPPGPRDFTFAAAAEGMTAQLAGQGAIHLNYLGDHTFAADFDPSLRIVFTVENGRATQVTLHQGGGTVQGARRP